VPQVIEACLKGRPLDLSRCEGLRDYMHVEDVADGILQLALLPQLPAPPIVVNIGSGRGLLLRDFVCAVAKELKSEDLMRFGTIPYRPSEMRALVANIDRLRSLLPGRPTVSIARGVRDAVAYARSAGALRLYESCS
jgi:nucleoside-diphosphate-sugar epimerase